MATRWPAVRARLVELLPTLPGWSTVSVYDGPTVTGEVPWEFATVGYVTDEDAAGSFEHERSGDGFRVEERGFVRCELVVASGDTDLAAVRARAFELIDALEQEIRRDRTLGVLSREGTARLVVDVIPVQNQAGAAQRLAFSVDYFTCD